MRGDGKIDQNRPKFHLIDHNFCFSHSITIKITFSESSHHYLSNDVQLMYNLSGFAEVRILPLFLVMASL